MISRRRFLQSSLTVALIPMLPKFAVAADLRVRQSWDQFCLGTTYASYLSAIQQMQANPDTKSPTSWEYWANVHRWQCPHNKPYFLAWHRGFLYRFEETLRQVSGDPNLVLPYWNYYNQPSIPAEFEDPSSPLYHSGRSGTDVYGALSMDPFDSALSHFTRFDGSSDSFEAVTEERPHDPVHNLIGGIMAWVAYSPRDPLFWVHHANIDRLWVAWVKAGGGRHQPRSGASYWDGTLNCGRAVEAVPTAWTIDTSSYLNYQYDDETMPTGLPPDPSASGATATTAGIASAGSTFSLARTTARPAVVQSLPLGSSQPLHLDENSTSIEITLNPQDANSVRSAMIQAPDASATSTHPKGPVRVVLDGIRVTGLGKKGGYFYKVFVNLPAQGVATGEERTFLVGMVGPFEISVAEMAAAMKGKGMHGMAHLPPSGEGDSQMIFPATEALKRAWPTDLSRITVSFVRVDGRKKPGKGRVIHVKAFRMEADPAA